MISDAESERLGRVARGLGDKLLSKADPNFVGAEKSTEQTTRMLKRLESLFT